MDVEDMTRRGHRQPCDPLPGWHPDQSMETASVVRGSMPYSSQRESTRRWHAVGSCGRKTIVPSMAKEGPSRELEQLVFFEDQKAASRPGHLNRVSE